MVVVGCTIFSSIHQFPQTKFIRRSSVQLLGPPTFAVSQKENKIEKGSSQIDTPTLYRPPTLLYSFLRISWKPLCPKSRRTCPGGTSTPTFLMLYMRMSTPLPLSLRIVSFSANLCSYTEDRDIFPRNRQRPLGLQAR